MSVLRETAKRQRRKLAVREEYKRKKERKEGRVKGKKGRIFGSLVRISHFPPMRFRFVLVCDVKRCSTGERVLQARNINTKLLDLGGKVATIDR